MRKTEASLKRLKKGRAADGAAADGAPAMSDTDKISMQLFLDVQARRRPSEHCVACICLFQRGKPVGLPVLQWHAQLLRHCTRQRCSGRCALHTESMAGAYVVPATSHCSRRLQQSLEHPAPSALLQEFGRQMFKFDMSPQDLPAYQTLWQTVAPADQQEIDAALLLG